jgi:hypothetical protein
VGYPAGQRRSQLSADPLGSVLRYSLPLEWKSLAGWGEGVPLPTYWAQRPCRPVAGHLQRQALRRFAASSGSASPSAGCSWGRRRGRRCASCRVLVPSGASASRPTARAARPHGSNRFSRTVVSACLNWSNVLGGSRRSVARCLTRRCSWQAQAAAQWGNAAQSSLRSQAGSCRLAAGRSGLPYRVSGARS